MLCNRISIAASLSARTVTPYCACWFNGMRSPKWFSLSFQFNKAVALCPGGCVPPLATRLLNVPNLRASRQEAKFFQWLFEAVGNIVTPAFAPWLPGLFGYGEVTWFYNVVHWFRVASSWRSRLCCSWAFISWSCWSLLDSRTKLILHVKLVCKFCQTFLYTWKCVWDSMLTRMAFHK